MAEAAWVLQRTMKWLGIGLLALTALACVLFLGALLVNARDEALTPEVRALLTPPPNPYGDQDNAYVALQGFDAPPAESVIAAGEARIEHYNRNIDAALRDPSAASLKASSRRTRTASPSGAMSASSARSSLPSGTRLRSTSSRSKRCSTTTTS